jgi:hypothetical protein
MVKGMTFQGELLYFEQLEIFINKLKIPGKKKKKLVESIKLMTSITQGGSSIPLSNVTLQYE